MMTLSKLLILIFVLSLSPFSVTMAADNDFSADVRYLHVQKGQTLHNIVKRLYPERQKEWPKLKEDIIRLNPHAFPGGDPTKMKAGVRLELPKKVVVRAVPAKPVKAKKVGSVVELEGSVVAVDQRKVTRKLTKGHPVYLGDKIITGETGYVRLKMVDNAILDLRCFSIMVIEQYALNTTNRTSILNLLQGSLRKVTGQIGKMTQDVYELKTPLASVGVRGTEYALRVFQSKGCGGTIDADDGMYIEVIKGLVDVQNQAGSEVIAKGETAYVPLPKSKPKKVALKPGVIKPVEKAPEPVAPVEAVAPVEEESGSVWWWLLGIVAVVLLI